MKANVKKGKDCKVKMTVEVEAELVENRFQEVFRGFQKAARLPGFREGKAPLDMIEKKFSQEAHEEVLKTLIPEAYHRSIATQKLSPVSMPSISDIQMQRGKTLTFSAEFDRSPEFSVKNYKGIRLKRESAELTDAEVEKGLASLRDSRADLLPLAEPRPVQKGDFVVVDVEIWKDGKYVPGKKGMLLLVEPTGSDDFFDKIVGANIDELREISAEGKPHYKLWIRAVKEKKPPALDEEFAKSFGKESVEDLKAAVRKDMAAYKHSESLGKMKNELFEKLMDLVTFTVPETLIEKQKERLIDQARREYQRAGMPKEKFEAESEKVSADAAAKALKQVKLYFILQNIAESEGIEADEIEIEKRLQGLVEESKRPIEEVRRMFEDDLRDSMRESATVDFLIANAKFEEDK